MVFPLIINYFHFPQISWAFLLSIKDLNYNDYMQMKFRLITKLTIFISWIKEPVFKLQQYTGRPEIQVNA
jgi:hypothetical protein